MDGQIRTTAQQGLFMDGLADHCDELVCFLHSPRKEELQSMEYVIESKKVKLVNIGIHARVYVRLLLQSYFVREFKRGRKNLDALLIRQPSPLFPFFAKLSSQLPLILLIVGDAVEEVKASQLAWWRKSIIQAYYKYSLRQLEKSASRSLVLVNNKSSELQWRNKAQSLKRITTTTVKADDLYYRTDTCKRFPIRLLFVGRLDRQKGLSDIAQATIKLNRKGMDVRLHIVGHATTNDPVLDEVKEIFSRHSMIHKLEHHGYLSLGPDLYHIYRKADIFITASIASEGFPRTIWEAFSQSLPVVATKIGGIPLLLADRTHAMLCAPRNPDQLADAVQEIIGDQELRRKLIRNGHDLVSKNTLEKTAETTMEYIKCWIDPQRVGAQENGKATMPNKPELCNLQE